MDYIECVRSAKLEPHRQRLQICHRVRCWCGGDSNRFKSVDLRALRSHLYTKRCYMFFARTEAMTTLAKTAREHHCWDVCGRKLIPELLFLGYSRSVRIWKIWLAVINYVSRCTINTRCMKWNQHLCGDTVLPWPLCGKRNEKNRS